MEIVKDKKQFDMTKELLELEHKLKTERLLLERENSEIQHQKELERMRIKNAEIKRNIERKENTNFANSYSRSQP